jgi:choline monooxygenase
MDGTSTHGAELRPALGNQAYTSPDVYRAEHEAILYRGWTGFCHDTDLPGPGAYRAGQIADQPVFLIRGKDGQVRGFYNVCRHRLHRIVEGQGTAERLLICPYHAWSYETDGCLRSARGAEKGQDRKALGLQPIRAEKLAGFWFVNLDPDAASLAETAPGLEAQILGDVPQAESYVRLCQGSYDVACNWKIYVENGLECYHCGPAHPGFCETVDLDAYQISSNGSFTRHWGQLKAGGQYSSWKLFPHTTLRSTTNPATITMIQVQPLAADRTVSTLTLFGPADMAGDRDTLHRNWVDTSFVKEDIALSQSVQTGMNSRAFPAGLIMHSGAYESEHMLTDFQNWIRARMGA